MTAAARSRTRPNEVRCEVRSPGTEEVIGYVVVGGAATCLEQALTENGFWLVPVNGRRAKARPAVAVA
jgi:hypothetical protein